MVRQTDLDQRAFFKECRALIKVRDEEALWQKLTAALRHTEMDSEWRQQAGKLLSRLTRAPDLHIAIHGQCTTSWVAPAVAAHAAADARLVKVTEGEYDNVIQELMGDERIADVVVLLPWTQRLLRPGKASAAVRVEAEYEFWLQVWRSIAARRSARIIQVGYDWLDTGAYGHFLGGQVGGEIDLIRKLNQRLRDNLPAGASFVDLEQLSGQLGRREFYDRRAYYWTKNPFSLRGADALARHIWAAARAQLYGPKKVLVVDLDHTLWGGVVGEVGAQAIDLGETPAGEAYLDFQRLLKQLGENGTLLAVCSKNNDEDAREPFERNQNMVLRLDDFAAFKASWEPKSRVLVNIAEELNLGLDSLVFFDDSPVERGEIRACLPEVNVIEVPTDPSLYRQALLESLCFESLQVTPEDQQRAAMYQTERQRQEAEADFENVDDYLASLDMHASFEPITEQNLQRVAQLVGKTNQFNLTNRRHSRDEIMEYLSRDRSIGLAVRLTDRFGDYGLVSVLLAAPGENAEADALIIDTWVMSCRVIGRTLEHSVFNALLDVNVGQGCDRLIGEFVLAGKNSPVAGLYPSLGFQALSGNTATCLRFNLDLKRAAKARTLVERRSTNA